MNEMTYRKMTGWAGERARLISVLNKVLTAVVFVAYPVLLVWLIVTRGGRLYLSIVVPLDGFIIVSVFRYFLNRPRPYEKFGMPPAIKKNTRGKSFPSRHVFSAAVIAVTFIVQESPILVGIGVVLLIIALALGMLRIICGIHFISDVVAALACAGASLVAYLILI
ncbi:MAG: phosphatase PAP2 family protein [Clostridiales bacterium]|nr:phosphatase PAP2 family protein [Clostridiales bacterium]